MDSISGRVALNGHRNRVLRPGIINLEQHRPGLFERLLLSGRLYDHLAEIDQTCRDRMERIISRMAEAEAVDEQLKASDQLGWISRMNSIHQRAEETVLNELIFDRVPVPPLRGRLSFILKH